MKRIVLGLALAVFAVTSVRADINENKIHDGAVTPAKIGALVENNSSATIAAGSLVYVCGWNENVKREKVCKADADASGKAAKYILRDSTSDANGATAYSTLRLSGVDTHLGAVGDPVYLSTTPGGWTLTAPSANNSIQQVVGRISVVSTAAGVIDFDLRGNNVVKVGTNELQTGISGSLPAISDDGVNVTITEPVLLTGSSTQGNPTVKALGAGSATSFVVITVPSGSRAAGLLEYSVEADDATDFQARSGVIPFAAVNKAGTITCTVGTVGAATEVVAASSGTLTNTMTCADGGSGALQLKANAASSLTETTLQIRYRVRALAATTLTVTPQ